MKKFYKTMRAILITCLCTALPTGCDGMEPSRENNIPPAAIEYKKITAEQAKAMMDSGDPFILLDCRTEEEFRERRIDGAILIPDDEISSRAEAELPDQSALILVYCRSGRRSQRAAHELIGMGYTNVYDLGGIIDWPYDTVSG